MDEERPWGGFNIIGQNRSKTTTIKVIYVNPHSRLSLQYHLKRSEDWTCLSGIVKAEVDGEITLLYRGDHLHVPAGTIHRFGTGLGDNEAQVLEVSYGDFDENDIVRISDDYGRVPEKPEGKSLKDITIIESLSS